MTHDVFISHSAHDRDVADAACIALEQRGFRCWIAPRDLAPGRGHGEAIAASRVFLLVVSAATDGREAQQAADAGLPMVALRIAEVRPEGLPASASWVDALTPPIAPHLDYLGDTVAELLDSVRRGPLPGTAPLRRAAPAWLPIALAGAAGVAAIALAAAYVGSKPG